MFAAREDETNDVNVADRPIEEATIGIDDLDKWSQIENF